MVRPHRIGAPHSKILDFFQQCAGLGTCLEASTSDAGQDQWCECQTVERYEGCDGRIWGVPSDEYGPGSRVTLSSWEFECCKHQVHVGHLGWSSVSSKPEMVFSNVLLYQHVRYTHERGVGLPSISPTIFKPLTNPVVKSVTTIYQNSSQTVAGVLIHNMDENNSGINFLLLPDEHNNTI